MKIKGQKKKISKTEDKGWYWRGNYMEG